jgi:hypothetical protein
MIDAIRINVSENIVYDKVKIYTIDEQQKMGIPDFFEDSQICFRDSFGKRYICDSDMVGDIILREMSPSRDFIKVARITITWNQLVFSPAWIIPCDKCEDRGIPAIFVGIKQFCFVSDGQLHITKDDRVGPIELE